MSKHPPARHAEKKRQSRASARRREAEAQRQILTRKALIELDAALQGFWDKYRVRPQEGFYYFDLPGPQPP